MNDRFILDSQAGFELAEAVASDGNLRVLRVFKSEDNLAGEPGVHLVDPVGVDEGGAVDAQETSRVETALELRDRLIDRVTAAVDQSISELVLGQKVSNLVQFEEADALADARGDAAGIAALLAAQRG